jgi:hypothetical protein
MWRLASLWDVLPWKGDIGRAIDVASASKSVGHEIRKAKARNRTDN